MDSLDVIQRFPQLCPLVRNKQSGDQQMTTTSTIKLLYVFGDNYGSDVIVVTTDDEVYCFGSNRYGRLGLGVGSDVHFERPQLNRNLSWKRLSKICYGLGHCIGLTTSGQCYGWGRNCYGQLGIGSTQDMLTPQAIEVLSKKNTYKRFIGICCGDNHTLGLTCDGVVYGWGANYYCQTGVVRDGKVLKPTRVDITDTIESISCGKHHSAALTTTRRVYVWGSNDSNQLGHVIMKRNLSYCSPRLINTFRHRIYRKVICGPNHTVLMIHNGRFHMYGRMSWQPIISQYKLFNTFRSGFDNKVQFKDIDITYDNKMLIVTTINNYQFILSSFPDTVSLIKIPVPATGLFNIYAKFCGFTETFESILEAIQCVKPMHTPIATKTNDKIIAEDSDSEIYYSYDDESDEEYTTPLAAKSVVTWALNPLAKEWRQKSCSEFDRQLGLDLTVNPILEKPTNACNQSVVNSVNGNQFLEPLVTDNGYTVTSIDSITSVSSYDPIMSRFKEFLWEAFNNPMDSDIVFILQNKPIYCNKAILKLRNKKFWQKCEQSLGTESEVKISVYSYETFIALLMYFYGLTPDVNDRNCTELIKLGNIYDEQELIDLCTQHISTIKS